MSPGEGSFEFEVLGFLHERGCVFSVVQISRGKLDMNFGVDSIIWYLLIMPCMQTLLS